MARVYILGAGVVGLTTALELQQKGHKVTIIAQHFPGTKSIAYTSPWAGAHHVTAAPLDDARQIKMDRETFDKMWELSNGDASHCLTRMSETESFADQRKYKLLEDLPDFKYLQGDSVPYGCTSAVQFTTIMIDPSGYLAYLFGKFLSSGGRAVPTAFPVQHIDQVLEGALTDGVKPELLVLCPGLGARFLGGVEDKDMYPIRGQTVIIRAPWLKIGRTHEREDGEWTYAVPRASGEVLLGGTKVANDWYPIPRPETARIILERAIALVPELSPTYSLTAGSPKPTADDLVPLIIEQGVGLRPARKGGIRLEHGVAKVRGEGEGVPVVYNYGHGGYGYQSSWGAARLASELVEEALKATATTA